MVLRMARPYKHPNSGVFYLRVRVPSDLVNLVGRTLEKQSLRTKDVGEARVRFAMAIADLTTRWSNLRQGLVRPTYEQMNAYSADFFDVYCREIETGRWSPFWDEALAAVTSRFVEMPNDRNSHSEFKRLCGGRIDDYFAQRGIRIVPEMRGAVDLRIAKAILDAISIRVRRVLDNDFAADPVEAKYQRPAGSKSVLKLDDAFETYAQTVGLSAATRKRWLPALRTLTGHSGTNDLARITDDHVGDWIEWLRADGKSQRTIKDVYLASAKALFRYYVGERKLVSNPIEGFSVRVPKRRTLRGPGLTDREVKLVLDGTLQAPPPRLAPCHVDARRWVPWLALYTGARVNELTQLRKADVALVDGIWSLTITPEAGSVKNYKVRIVPLHNHLLEQGFVKFVERCQRSTLFFTTGGKSTEAALTPYKKMGENLASWIRELGVTDPEVAPNHGFRHRFKTMARRAGMDAEIRDYLQGHAPRTEGEHYGEYPTAILKTAIDLIPTWTEVSKKLQPKTAKVA
jgi:integrase